MKRLAPALCLLFLLPAVAHAFQPEPRPERIGLLRISGGGAIGDVIVEQLRRELRRAGYDAYTVPATYLEVRDGMGADADYYVEVIGDASTIPHGGVAVGGRHVGVSVAVVVSRLAGELRIYDGRSLELLASHDLQQRSSAVLPTGIGVGTRSLGFDIALPFARWAQDRRLMRGAAREAAQAVAALVRGDNVRGDNVRDGQSE